MQSKESISVVIPTYNRANDLIAAIKSVLAQTYPVTEIVVCDDGSSDNSKKLVAALNNPVIKWIDCGTNGRPAIPRNTGIQQSKGNWVAFLDSDDSWAPQKIEQQINAIHKFNLKAACTNAVRIRNGEERGAYVNYGKEIVKLPDLMIQNSIICSSVIINKDLLLNTSLFPTERRLVAEDYALWLRIATQTDFVFLNENLVNYSDNFETSVRSQYKGDNWDMFKIIFSDFKDWMKSKNIVLSKFEKQALKKQVRKIEHKGIPTAWEEFERKFRDKFGLNKENN